MEPHRAKVRIVPERRVNEAVPAGRIRGSAANGIYCAGIWLRNADGSMRWRGDTNSLFSPLRQEDRLGPEGSSTGRCIVADHLLELTSTLVGAPATRQVTLYDPVLPGCQTETKR